MNHRAAVHCFLLAVVASASGCFSKQSDRSGGPPVNAYACFYDHDNCSNADGADPRACDAALDRCIATGCETDYCTTFSVVESCRNECFGEFGACLQAPDDFDSCQVAGESCVRDCGELEYPRPRPVDPEGWFADAYCLIGDGTELDSLYGASTTAGGLVVIGIYEATRDHSILHSSTGDFRVRVERTEPVTLVLSAHHSTRWTIEVASGAKVDRIIVITSGPASVSAPAGIPVEIHGSDGDWPLSFQLESSGGEAASAQQLIDRAMAETSLPLNGFIGCYHMDEVTIGM